MVAKAKNAANLIKENQLKMKQEFENSILHKDQVRCSVLQCVAVCCSLLLSVAACCCLLQCTWNPNSRTAFIKKIR